MTDGNIELSVLNIQGACWKRVGRDRFLYYEGMVTHQLVKQDDGYGVYPLLVPEHGGTEGKHGFKNLKQAKMWAESDLRGYVVQ